jgi:hypothetical protein
MPEKEPGAEAAESPDQSNRKAAIIEEIFKKRWNPTTGEVSNLLVTLQDLSKAIQSYNVSHKQRPLSDGNPANFFQGLCSKQAPSQQELAKANS